MELAKTRERYKNITGQNIIDLTELGFQGQADADAEVIELQKAYPYPEGEAGFVVVDSLPSLPLI